jgi:hypothetical protein
VGPTLELERSQLGTGPSVRIEDFEYALILPEELLDALAGPLALQIEFSATVMPVAEIVVTGLAPRQIGQPRIEPAAAQVVVTGLAPKQIGQPRIEVGAAEVVVSGLAPQILKATDVIVPAAQVAVRGYAPDEVGVVRVDPFFEDVSALLRMDGEENATEFVDNSNRNLLVTVYGGARITTTESRFGGACGEFNGVDSYLEIPPDGATIGTGDYTVECSFKVRPGADPEFNNINTIFRLNPDEFGNHWLYVLNERLIYDTNTLVGDRIVAGPIISDNTWYDVAVSRRNGVETLFLNRNLVGTYDYSLAQFGDGNIDDNVITIGYWFFLDDNFETVGFFYNGFIDEFRVTKGVGRYAVGTGANAGRMVYAGTNNPVPLPTNRFPGIGPES